MIVEYATNNMGIMSLHASRIWHRQHGISVNRLDGACHPKAKRWRDKYTIMYLWTCFNPDSNICSMSEIWYIQYLTFTYSRSSSSSPTAGWQGLFPLTHASPPPLLSSPHQIFIRKGGWGEIYKSLFPIEEHSALMCRRSGPSVAIGR